MAIDSLRSGAIEICFDPSLNVYPNKCRILIEGQMLDTGIAKDGVLLKMPSLRDVNEQFGEGSVITEGLKTAFACCADNALDFYALPRKDASVGAVTKAQYTMTFTGDATTYGRVDMYMGDGRWRTSDRIVLGTTAGEIATIVAETLMREPGLPFEVLNTNVGEITLTAKNAGTVGNCFRVFYNWHERRDYAPKGVEFEFKQTIAGQNIKVQHLDYIALLGECCYCCIGMLYDDTYWQDAMIAYIASAWDCSKPQCFGHGYTYNTGTIGEIMSTDTNSAEVSRLAHCCGVDPTTGESYGDPAIGWMKVAAYAAQSCCLAVDHPEMNIQGPDFGILRCVHIPESCFQCFTYDEQQLLQATGFVVTVPYQGGTGHLTSPMIVNDSTNNRYDDDMRLNSTWWDVSSRRLAAVTADQMALELGKVLGLGLFTKNTTIPPGIRGTNPKLILGMIRTWAKAHVGILFSEFDDLDNDIQLRTDFEVAPRCQGVCGKLWVNFIYRPPCRIRKIHINAQPRLLDNCY
jgi:hypothetical protein